MEDSWQGRASRLFCFLVAIGALWALLHFAGAVVWSVAIAWGVAMLVTPPAKALSSATGLSRRLWAVICVLLLLSLGGGLLFFGVSVLWDEAGRLFATLSENRAWIKPELGAFGSDLAERLPLLSEVEMAWLGGLLSEWLDDGLASLGKTLAAGVGQAARELPGVMVFLVVTVMGCFYLSMDYERLRDRLLSLLSTGGREHLLRLRAGVSKTVRGWLRAYLILLCLTFSELLVGLLILRRPYPLLIALGIALLDVLPVLGVGTVLIPWGIVMLAMGELPVGIGLLVLYAVITVVHQIVEPKLIGDRLGLHPFVSLMAMFLGLRLFGMMGMLLSPFVAVVIKDTVGDRQGSPTNRYQKGDGL